MIDPDRITNDPTYEHYAYRPQRSRLVAVSAFSFLLGAMVAALAFAYILGAVVH